MGVHDRGSGDGFVIERGVSFLSLDDLLLRLVLVHGISLISLFLNRVFRMLSLDGTAANNFRTTVIQKEGTYVTLLPYLSTSVTTVSGPASVSCQVWTVV